MPVPASPASAWRTRRPAAGGPSSTGGVAIRPAGRTNGGSAPLPRNPETSIAAPTNGRTSSTRRPVIRAGSSFGVPSGNVSRSRQENVRRSPGSTRAKSPTDSQPRPATTQNCTSRACGPWLTRSASTAARRARSKPPSGAGSVAQA